jgi:hypothetical protein
MSQVSFRLCNPTEIAFGSGKIAALATSSLPARACCCSMAAAAS